jgi:DNA-binding CsgD family transcriptional regulator
MILSPLCTIVWTQTELLQPVIIARHHDLGLLERLTARELQVLAMITKGHSTNEVAEQLHRSRRTIDCHRASIGHKLDVMGLPELTVLSAQAGLIRHCREYDPSRGDELHLNRPLLARLIEIKSHAMKSRD